MQITTALTAVAFLIASTAAQSPTTTGTAAAASTSDLPSMVSQLPKCALGCLDSAAKSIDCNAADLTCLCSNSSDFIEAIGPCIVLSSGCTSDEQDQITSLAGSICKDVVANPNSPELTSASNYLTSAMATGTGASASSATGNAAVRTDLPVAGMGVMGAAAALAAFAL
ncbi:hypothetical protein VMCG_05901 [Cytospora schulzeri]|uniref:CFEM domain-containing protein n=1 Tax=Cytospora schulzeri TaxID=448051 RepID=A0A423WD53_9PEZI|nr:hypothetical protein VMCG_05901 [Valsa malicola]